jgi:tetratricopeptide (TPR) repeat protein
MASIDLEEGAYPEAREKFGRALAIRRQIGNRPGEAAVWHQLAVIDEHEGAYPEAREKFGRALAIFQETGELASEAAAWHGLGFLAVRMGKPVEGLQLVALCFLIDHTIGHGSTHRDFEDMADLARRLGYSQDQLKTTLRRVADSYDCDRGMELLREAFD